MGHSPPVTDKSQDWKLLYGEENEFGTVLKFVRAINTCDDAGDQVIQVIRVLVVVVNRCCLRIVRKI